MRFIEEIQRALEIVQLKWAAIDEAAQDDEAFPMGIAIIALSGVAWALGATLLFPGLLFVPLVLIVVAFLVAGLLHILATVFGGQGDFIRFFRPYSYTYVLQVVAVIPWLGWMLGLLALLWQMRVSVLIIERIYGLERLRAAISVAVVFGLGSLVLVVFGSTIGFFIYMFSLLSR